MKRPSNEPRSLRSAFACILGLAIAFCPVDSLSAWTRFDIYLWPDGRVPYRFADAADDDSLMVVTCTEIGKSCTGSLCPICASPPDDWEDNAVEIERRESLTPKLTPTTKTALQRESVTRP